MRASIGTTVIGEPIGLSPSEVGPNFIKAKTSEQTTKLEEQNREPHIKNTSVQARNFKEAPYNHTYTTNLLNIADKCIGFAEKSGNSQESAKFLEIARDIAGAIN